MATRKRSAGPREEHPLLIGCSEVEATKLERAAKACDMPRAAFVRESALANADVVLGSKK